MPSKRGHKLRWRVLGVTLLVVLTWAYTAFRGDFARELELGNDQPTNSPARLGKGGVRIVSWNLRRLGDAEEETDLKRLSTSLKKLDADLIAVQEIMDLQLLDELRPQWRTSLSQGGGRGDQHVGFWWDPKRISLIGDALELPELSMGGFVRPGLLAQFESQSGTRFLAFVVHLKATSEGQAMRHEQWEAIVRIVNKEAQADLPLVLLGDFNATGSTRESAQAERRAASKQFSKVGLVALPNREGCSAYWQGRKRDAWLEASLLDLVWTRGFEPAQVWAAAQCGVHRCERFRSTPAHPDLDYTRVSDHCPIVMDLSVSSP